MEKEYLVKKWLNNELSEAEAQAFNALDNAGLYEEIVLEAQRFKGDEQAKVLPFNELDNLLTTKENTNSTNWIKVVLRVAAIFVVGVGLFKLLNQNNMNSFATEYAQNETITLPDNSIVKLNQLSQLQYNESKWDKKRSLELKGEAFFDVEKGERFEVITQFGTVSVLGTEFNVMSRDSILKVSCYEGLVQVSYNNKEVKVPAGTEFTLTSGSVNKTNIVIAEPYWLKGMSVFENAPLEAVLYELEKQYKVKINYQSGTIIHFTGAFEHNNLENALKSVTQPLNLSYIMTPNQNEVIIRNAKN